MRSPSMILLCLTGFFGLAVTSGFSQTINTAAGTGVSGYTGDGGLATAARLSNTEGVAVDAQNNIYIVDTGNNVVRKVNFLTGIITTVVGTGVSGYSGDGGPATSATLRSPSSIAVDSQGNLYICDSWNHAIRKVTASTGIITTIAGTGVAGYSGNNGPATSAKLSDPDGITLDSSGNVYFSELLNNVVRKINISTGIISLVAGTNVYGYNGDNIPAVNSELAYPEGLIFDSQGNLLIADGRNYRIRKVNMSTGVITTVAGQGLQAFSGDGGPATLAGFNYPGCLAMDCSGNLYIGDEDNLRIRKVDAITGIITTVAGSGVSAYSGDGGPATSAGFAHIEDTAFDSFGNLYIADEPNYATRKITGLTAPCTTTTTTTPTFTPTLTPTATPTSSPSGTVTPILTPTPTSSPTPTITSSQPCSITVFYVSKNLFRPSQESVSILVQYDCYPGGYSLRIYNSAGEHIKTLDAHPLNMPLNQSYSWDGTNKYNETCASGVYLLELDLPYVHEIKRVLLVR